jgi:2-polyprenyl-6-methoxyphenol hydroxylase-like FAD-dependent oxidoreductase
MMGQHAIVMGASMAGLLAARVLTDYFDRVTLIERDTLPDSPANRRGVPQGRHTHGLLASGRRILDHLFPGISTELIEGDAIAGDISRDARWFCEGGWLARATSGLDGLLMTRPFLEAVVRRRALALDRLHTLQDTTAEGLRWSADGRRVIGISIGGECLSADLVVDATGRGSRTPQWLEAAGFEPPREERVEVDLRYTTRLFRRRITDLQGDSAVVIPPTPAGKRGGVMLAQEGERWTVTLISHFGDGAPLEVSGFVAYARQLPAPAIYEVIRDAVPIGEAASARFPASIRCRYESLSRLPERLLVVGDAICSFNPIYGQGMSVSALEALALKAALDEGMNDLTRRFFVRAATIVDTPWNVAVGSDLRMPEAKGPRSAGLRFVNWYMARLHKAAHRDPVLAETFLRVANLVAPPRSLMGSAVALRVLRGQWRTDSPISGILERWTLQNGSSS